MSLSVMLYWPGASLSVLLIRQELTQCLGAGIVVLVYSKRLLQLESPELFLLLQQAPLKHLCAYSCGCVCASTSRTYTPHHTVSSNRARHAHVPLLENCTALSLCVAIKLEVGFIPSFLTPKAVG